MDVGCGALPLPFPNFDTLALVRLDANGNCVSSKGGYGAATFTAMAFSAGGFSVTGNLFSVFDFGGGPLQPGPMIASFDATAQHVFSHSSPAPQDHLQTRPQDVRVDGSGNFVIAGYFGGGACVPATGGDPPVCSSNVDCTSQNCVAPKIDFGLGNLPAMLKPYEGTFSSTSPSLGSGPAI